MLIFPTVILRRLQGRGRWIIVLREEGPQIRTAVADTLGVRISLTVLWSRSHSCCKLSRGALDERIKNSTKLKRGKSAILSERGSSSSSFIWCHPCFTYSSVLLWFQILFEQAALTDSTSPPQTTSGTAGNDVLVPTSGLFSGGSVSY